MGFAVGFLAQINKIEDRNERREELLKASQLAYRRELLPMLAKRIEQKKETEKEVGLTSSFFNQRLKGVEKEVRDNYVDSLLLNPEGAKALKSSIEALELKHRGLTLKDNKLIDYSDVSRQTFEAIAPEDMSYEDWTQGLASLVKTTKDGEADINRLFDTITDDSMSIEELFNTEKELYTSPGGRGSVSVDYSTDAGRVTGLSPAEITHMEKAQKTEAIRQLTQQQSSLEDARAKIEEDGEFTDSAGFIHTLEGVHTRGSDGELVLATDAGGKPFKSISEQLGSIEASIERYSPDGGVLDTFGERLVGGSVKKYMLDNYEFYPDAPGVRVEQPVTQKVAPVNIPADTTVAAPEVPEPTGAPKRSPYYNPYMKRPTKKVEEQEEEELNDGTTDSNL